ncbi:hypothetical protein, partial [Stenotrophomonas maltophilia]|uniref:hypothetical protein n=1 Tax=Stenotrophomonas maltophilia TaxID=40324 RepID=UPI002556B588
SGLVEIHRNQLFADIFTLFDQDTYVNPFSLELLGPHYIALAIEGFVLFFLNIIVEYVQFSCSFITKRSSKMTLSINEDSDEMEERKKAHQNRLSQFDILRVLGVSKSFQSMFGKKIAVDNVSFSIPQGEVSQFV